MYLSNPAVGPTGFEPASSSMLRRYRTAPPKSEVSLREMEHRR